MAELQTVYQRFHLLSPSDQRVAVAYIQGYCDCAYARSNAERTPSARLDRYEREGGEIDTSGFSIADFERLSSIQSDK